MGIMGNYCTWINLLFDFLNAVKPLREVCSMHALESSQRVSMEHPYQVG